MLHESQTSLITVKALWGKILLYTMAYLKKILSNQGRSFERKLIALTFVG